MAPDGDAQPPLGQDIVLASQEIRGSVPSGDRQGCLSRRLPWHRVAQDRGGELDGKEDNTLEAMVAGC